jgi:hypothetical protein
MAKTTLMATPHRKVLSSRLASYVVALSLLALLAPLPVGAQQPSAPDADGDGVPDDKDACPKEPGIKSSDPKTSGCAARVDAGKVKSSAEVTFSGYQTLPGERGMVFVELTDAVVVEASREGQVMVYKLVGARVPLKNNKNPLLLRHFNSSAVSAALVSDKKSVRLVITLRGGVSPTHRMVARARGAALEVELPPPSKQ